MDRQFIVILLRSTFLESQTETTVAYSFTESWDFQQFRNKQKSFIIILFENKIKFISVLACERIKKFLIFLKKTQSQDNSSLLKKKNLQIEFDILKKGEILQLQIQSIAIVSIIVSSYRKYEQYIYQFSGHHTLSSKWQLEAVHMIGAATFKYLILSSELLCCIYIYIYAAGIINHMLWGTKIIHANFTIFPFMFSWIRVASTPHQHLKGFRSRKTQQPQYKLVQSFR